MAKKGKTKCIYCNLTLIGKGCVYSPSGIHIHPTPDKCMYCGLSIVGKGCQYSPTGVHTRFVDYGAIQAEQAQNHLILAYLIEKLHQPFTDSAAYINGIVDESGYQIKTPETYMEERSFTPLDKYIFRLKRIFGEQLDVLNTEMLLEASFKYLEEESNAGESWNPDEYLKQSEAQHTLRTELAQIMSEYYNCIRKASKSGVSTAILEKTLIQVLTDHDDKK